MIVIAQSELYLAYSLSFEIKAPPLEVLAFIECYIPEDQSFAAIREYWSSLQGCTVQSPPRRQLVSNPGPRHFLVQPRKHWRRSTRGIMIEYAPSKVKSWPSGIRDIQYGVTVPEGGDPEESKSSTCSLKIVAAVRDRTLAGYSTDLDCAVESIQLLCEARAAKKKRVTI